MNTTMYKIRYSVGLKTLAVFLFVISLAVSVLSAMGIFVMFSESVYIDGGRSFTASLWESTLHSKAAAAADHVYTQYKYSMDRNEKEEDIAQLLQGFQNTYSASKTNMLFSIEYQGEEIFSNGSGSGIYAETAFDYWFYWSNRETTIKTFNTEREMEAYILAHSSQWNSYIPEIIYEEDDIDYVTPVFQLTYETFVDTEESVQVTAWVDDIQVMDIFYWVRYFSDALTSGLPWGLIVLEIVSLIICTAALVFLLCGAGHRSDTDGVVLERTNRIPLDLYAAGIILGWILLGFFIADVTYDGLYDIGTLILFGFSCICIILLTLALTLSVAARLKAGGVIKNTVLYRFSSVLWRILRRGANRISYICKGLPLVWKAGLIYGGLSLIELIFLSSTGAGYLLLAWCVEKLILTPLLALALINMKHLKKGAEEIADGNLNYQVKLPDLIGDFRRHGQTLNRIGDGMQVALEQKMQSERLKTELITNVSHDIKTPLTSIINYVDLLKKEGMDSPNASQYLEVLERQSARLKKLTEDLVEASKASSGAINVVKAPTNVQVLLEQTVGEFEERLEKNGIQVVLSPCESQSLILADGRLLWRVFDNLMNNICKYALSGTRVYLNMENTGDAIRIVFKNISAYPLNISGEELMERFVRGDRSRNTEGSGLGLSIARSLLELQGGTLEIQIDGDLFKSVITIPTAETK
ncbi:MAG: HAMP domain-containing histidine kinase [Clostridiales bacterium]|nr:HAMP domain-containing histidine kinase [Clostridiales bacterium]